MTATAPIKRDWQSDQRRIRVVRAATDWVYNQSCSTALMELEDSVTDLVGVDIGEGRRRPKDDR